jgi:hypothetical protein
MMLLARYPDGSEYVGVKSDDLDSEELAPGRRSWVRQQDTVPAVRDLSWQPLTLGLLRHLTKGNISIDAVVAWGRSQGHTGALVRHMLAWLSFTGKVHYVPGEAIWRCGPEPYIPLSPDLFPEKINSSLP